MNDLTGNKYGRWTVILEGERGHQGKRRWNCICECGTRGLVYQDNLLSGKSESCGCLRQERSVAKCRTHGERHSRLYRIWTGMKTRCNNSYHTAYKDYGGRGVTICDEWSDYTVFRDWALSHGYADNLTIDRIDNDGNYEPSNCRWVTQATQVNNCRSNRILEYNGERHTMAEWSKLTNIPYHTLAQRLEKLNWSVERALTEKARYLQHGKCNMA